MTTTTGEPPCPSLGTMDCMADRGALYSDPTSTFITRTAHTKIASAGVLRDSNFVTQLHGYRKRSPPHRMLVRSRCYSRKRKARAWTLGIRLQARHQIGSAEESRWRVDLWKSMACAKFEKCRIIHLESHCRVQQNCPLSYFPLLESHP